MDKKPTISIVIPIHNMENGAEFLWRSINMLMKQTFQDYEIVITKAGKMAENTNAGIRKARGELIKILYLDDYFENNHALQNIVDNFKRNDMWMITGTDDNLEPYWTDDIYTGNNRLGSPSALTIRNKNPMLFDENLSWLLDCDYYERMYRKHGAPKILNGENVVLGKGKHQMTHILPDVVKQNEFYYLQDKYA